MPGKLLNLKETHGLPKYVGKGFGQTTDNFNLWKVLMIQGKICAIYSAGFVLEEFEEEKEVRAL